MRELTEADPDFVVFAVCGFTVERCAKELLQTSILGDPQWNALAAVRRERVYVVDGNRYFNRSGPSLVDSAEILGHILGIMPSSSAFGPDDFSSLKAALARVGGEVLVQSPQLAEAILGCKADADALMSVVCETVASLQDGSDEAVLRAYNNSAVSSCLPLERYIAVILRNSDFEPLSRKSLTPRYAEPQFISNSLAKVVVHLEGTAGAAYSFR